MRRWLHLQLLVVRFRSFFYRSLIRAFILEVVRPIRSRYSFTGGEVSVFKNFVATFAPSLIDPRGIPTDSELLACVCLRQQDFCIFLVDQVELSIVGIVFINVGFFDVEIPTVKPKGAFGESLANEWIGFQVFDLF